MPTKGRRRDLDRDDVDADVVAGAVDLQNPPDTYRLPVFAGQATLAIRHQTTASTDPPSRSMRGGTAWMDQHLADDVVWHVGGRPPSTPRRRVASWGSAPSR
jgi:hypothetical protein